MLSATVSGLEEGALQPKQGEDLNTILGRITNAFSKFETGMVPSGKAVETRGRLESDFDEYHETFKAGEENSTTLVFAENKDLESETFNTHNNL